MTSRYNSKSMINMVKHPESVMVWGAFSGNNGIWVFSSSPRTLPWLEPTIGGSGAVYAPQMAHPLMPSLHA